MRKPLVPLLLSILMATPASAAPDALPMVRIETLLRAPADQSTPIAAFASTLRQAAAELAQLADLPAAPPLQLATLPGTLPPFPAGHPAQVTSGDLQIALTQLAIHTGANGQLLLVQAQAGKKDAIFLREGHSTLAEVAAAAADNALTLQGDTWHLTRPLVVWADAGLMLQPGDQLEIDRASGAFLLAFGRLDLMGADVSAGGDANTAAADFAPFVLVTGQGSLVAQNMQFSALGFGGSDMFGGIAVVGRGLFQPAFPPVLINNHFTDIGRVALVGTKNALFSGNLIDAPRSGGVSIVGGTGLSLVGNTVRASRSGSAIRLADVKDTTVAGNLVAGSAQNGLTVEGISRDLTLADNVIVANGGTGVAITRSDCIAAHGNIIGNNGAAGMRLRASGSYHLTQNALLLNHTAGLDVQRQKPGTSGHVQANVFAGNREGMRGANIGEVLLSDNRLDAQLPRLFGGEFTQYLPGFLTSMQQHDATEFRIALAGRDTAQATSLAQSTCQPE
ncbi:MAG: right-handed parallel beta-helix repeat-containing protein [Paracoccaceae bacterium]